MSRIEQITPFEQPGDQFQLFRFAAWFSLVLALGLGVAMELL